METILGAVIAAAVGAGTWGTGPWWAKHQEGVRERKELARELIRSRGDQPRFASALNEIPVVFDDDATLMTLYRQFASGHATDEAMLALLLRLAEVTGVGKSANPDDLKRFCSVAS